MHYKLSPITCLSVFIFYAIYKPLSLIMDDSHKHERSFFIFAIYTVVFPLIPFGIHLLFFIKPKLDKLGVAEVMCPHCQDRNNYTMDTKNHLRCGNCGESFIVFPVNFFTCSSIPS